MNAIRTRSRIMKILPVAPLAKPVVKTATATGAKSSVSPLPCNVRASVPVHMRCTYCFSVTMNLTLS